MYARNNNLSAFSVYTYICKRKLRYTATEWECSGAVVVGHIRQSMGARINWYHRCPIRRNECIALCMESGAINANRLQQQRQQTLLSAYCLTIPMHCGWRCRQRLYATAGDSELCLPCIASAKVLTFFFLLFFYGHSSTEKKKNENADVFFGRKIKCLKIKRKRNSVGLYKELAVWTSMSGLRITKVTF